MNLRSFLHKVSENYPLAVTYILIVMTFNLVLNLILVMSVRR